MPTINEVADMLLAYSNGLKPYDASKNQPRDIGLGGPSTEYVASKFTPYGDVMNYPQIWWDNGGKPVLLPPDAAYQQAMQYEQTSGLRFPRFLDIGAADVAAENRSAKGGGDVAPLATLLGQINW